MIAKKSDCCNVYIKIIRFVNNIKTMIEKPLKTKKGKVVSLKAINK